MYEELWVASSIPGQSHTFVEIDHELIFTVIPLPSADSVVICAQSTNRFFKLAQEKRCALGQSSYFSFHEHRLYKTESAVSYIVGSLYS